MILIPPLAATKENKIKAEKQMAELKKVHEEAPDTIMPYQRAATRTLVVIGTEG